MGKHSKERIFERYNLELSETDERQILSNINYGNFLPIYQETKDPKHLKFAYVKFNKIPIKVLYKCSNKGNVTNIITAYPLDVDEYNKLVADRTRKEIEFSINFLKLNGYIVYKRGKDNGKNNR